MMRRKGYREDSRRRVGEARVGRDGFAGIVSEQGLVVGREMVVETREGYPVIRVVGTNGANFERPYLTSAGQGG